MANTEVIKLLDRGGCGFGKELTERVDAIDKRVLDVLGKLDVCSVSCNMLVKGLEERIDGLERGFEVLEDRLAKLEKKIMYLLGVYTVIGGVLGFIAGKFF